MKSELWASSEFPTSWHETDAGCFEVRFKYDATFTHTILLSADRHIDNNKSDRTLQHKHLKQAKEWNATIYDFGDFYDLMQGKNDRRSSKSALMERHSSSSYVDDVIKDGVEFFSPYAENVVMMSLGNHETGIIKHLETNPTNRTVEMLNLKHGSNIMAGLYNGWVRFRFEQKGGGGVKTINMRYHHGHGGGGEVTKGTIQATRRAVYLPDAHIVVGGHIHENWVLEIPRERFQQNGKKAIDKQTHIQLATYKEEYLCGKGWHVERGAPPKPIGARWLQFYYEFGEIKYRTWKAE